MELSKMYSLLCHEKFENSHKMTKKILFVCTGNICRSPAAHAIARHKAKIYNKEARFVFDSAGTDSYHVGQAPDSRSVIVGEKNGVSFSDIYARQITKNDFADFDLILAMDRGHLARMRSRAPAEYHHKIKLFLEFCDVENKWDDEVIDPYYGDHGFDEVFALLDQGIDNLILEIFK